MSKNERRIRRECESVLRVWDIQWINALDLLRVSRTHDMPIVRKYTRILAGVVMHGAPALNDSDECFDKAIDCGKLSVDKNAPNYAGNYMYMGTRNGTDLFKNIDTRKYL